MQNITQGGPAADVAQSKTEMVRFKAKLDGLRQRLQGGDVEDKELRKACQDFEAVFIGKLWNQMRKSIPESDLLHSKQEKMYLSMFDRAFSEKMAENGGIGLQDMMYEQLKDKLDKAGKETLPSRLDAPRDVRPLADAEGVRIQPLGADENHALEGRQGSSTQQGETSGPAAFSEAGKAEIRRRVDELALRIEMQAAGREQAAASTADSRQDPGPEAPTPAAGAGPVFGTSAEASRRGQVQSDLAMARAAKVYDELYADDIVAKLAGNLQEKP